MIFGPLFYFVLLQYVFPVFPYLMVVLAGLRALVVFYSVEFLFLRVVLLLYMLLLLLVFALRYYLYYILCACPWP